MRSRNTGNANRPISFDQARSRYPPTSNRTSLISSKETRWIPSASAIFFERVDFPVASEPPIMISLGAMASYEKFFRDCSLLLRIHPNRFLRWNAHAGNVVTLCDGKFNEVRQVIFTFCVQIFHLSNVLPEPFRIKTIERWIHFRDRPLALHRVFVLTNRHDVTMFVTNDASPMII